MENIITAPSLNVNDEYVKMVEWRVANGATVKRHDLICIIETTKTSFDVESDYDGYIFFPDNTGQQIKIGDLMGVVSDNPKFDFSSFYEKYAATSKSDASADSHETGTIKWTLKAEKLAEKLQLSTADVEKFSAGKSVINEEVVNAFVESKSINEPVPVTGLRTVERTEVLDNNYPSNRQERVLILGGGGGGVLAIDIISRNPNQRVVGILDNNPDLHNKTIMGVKVLGGFDLAEQLWNNNFFDGVISTLVKDPKERAAVYNDFRGKGINFTNVISESVNIRLNVEMGKGNLIISDAYFAPCVRIGDNNFFAAGSCVEHHSTIGNHCLFGPRFTSSGAVTIGDYCKFGMGVLIEPYVSIGKNSLIASGSLITNHVKENSIVKNLKTTKAVEKE